MKRAIIKPLTPPDAPLYVPRNAIRLMIGQAAARFGVTPTDVFGDRRIPAVAAARQAVMWNLRARFDLAGLDWWERHETERRFAFGRMSIAAIRRHIAQTPLLPLPEVDTP